MKIRKLLAGVAALCLLGVTSGCSLLGLTQSRDPNAEVTASTNVDAFSLRLGDCILTETLMQEEVGSVPVVPCSEPHDAEVIYIFDVNFEDFDAYALEEAAEEECYRAVEEYVGPNWESVSSGGLEVNYLTPTEGSWSNGDREIDCIAYSLGEELEFTSSMKGAGA
ncbi:MAG: septum formation family protein [Propionibacteriaceae bacterium]|nr:septum formation family protein [Propionibacteriaceae bacterium]